MLFDKLNFEIFASFFHHSYGFVGVELIFFKRKSLFDDFLHFSFDFFKNFGSEGNVNIKIIVKTAVDSGADCKLCVGEKSLDRLSKDMGSCVAQSPLAVSIVKSENFELAVFFERCSQVGNNAVDFAYAGCLIKTHAEAFGNFHGGCSVFELLDYSAFKRYVYHFNHPF